MNMFKKAAISAAMALAFSGAHASMINVGGVNWDPDAATDFSSQSINIRQFIDQSTGVLSGFGVITAFNGQAQASFCPGCELTFQFGGFTPVIGSATLLPGFGQSVNYSNGWVKVYVGAAEIANPNDYLSLNAANTGNGSLWLSLAQNGIFTGTNTGILSGLGFLDVVGGLAASNFDTNTQDNGSDIRYSASLTYDHVPGSILDMSGTANMRGNTIPEPATMALLGFGLFGAGLARRRATKSTK